MKRSLPLGPDESNNNGEVNRAVSRLPEAALSVVPESLDGLSTYVEEARAHISRSTKLMRQAPVPYGELLTDAFSQLDTTLEELEVAEHELRQQTEILLETRDLVDTERRRYRSLFDNAPDGYVVTDPVGIITEANLTAAQYFKIGHRFLIRKPLANLIADEERSAFRKTLLNFENLHGSVVKEMTLRPRASAPFRASVTVAADRSPSGRLLALRWMIKDISTHSHISADTSVDAAIEQRVNERTADLSEAYRRDRLVAQMLQARILREPDENAFAGLTIKTFYQSASRTYLIGGDFFDAFGLPDGRVALSVGDVSGKGLIAASHTAEVKFSLRACLRSTLSARESLESFNAYLVEVQRAYPDKDGVLVALSLCIIDAATGRCEFAVAGAEPTLVLRRPAHVEAIRAPGLPLGVMPDVEYCAQEVTLYPGDRLVMATDGITEARQGEEFLNNDGLARLALESLKMDSIADAGNSIMQGASSFAGGHLSDDACLLVAEWKGKPE